MQNQRICYTLLTLMFFGDRCPCALRFTLKWAFGYDLSRVLGPLSCHWFISLLFGSPARAMRVSEPWSSSFSGSFVLVTW